MNWFEEFFWDLAESFSVHSILRVLLSQDNPGSLPVKNTPHYGFSLLVTNLVANLNERFEYTINTQMVVAYFPNLFDKVTWPVFNIK